MRSNSKIYFLCLALSLIGYQNQAQAQADDFAEFEQPTAAPTSTLDNVETVDKDPLDVLEKKSESQQEPAPVVQEPQPVVEKPKEVTPPPPPVLVLPAPTPELEPKVEPVVPTPEPVKPIVKEAEPKKTRQQIVNEDPNFKIEKRIHDNYQKYNEQPTNVEAWDQAVGNRRSENYKVQKGDTLWDLSEALFGDSNYWPKVWSLNKDEILNPHQIEPQMSIRFYPGTVSEVPTLGILTKEKSDEAFHTPKNLAIVDPSALSSKLKGPGEPTSKPVGKIPASLPLYRMGEVNKPPVDYQLSSPIKITNYASPLQYMMVDELPTAVGTIKETELGLSSAAEFQYVFVQLDDPRVKVVTVMTEKEKVGGGTLIELQGELEIIDKVNESNDDGKDKNLYRAIVKRNLSLIQVGSKLISGPLPRYDLSLGPEFKTESPVRILGGVQGDHMSIFSKQSYIFLGSGKNQGLVKGQLLPVYKNLSIRVPNTRVEFLAGEIGKIKVISVSDNFSTGYLIENTEDIRRGDWVGVPGVVIPLAAAPAQDSASKAVESKVDFKDDLDKEFENETPVKADIPASEPYGAPAEGDLQL